MTITKGDKILIAIVLIVNLLSVPFIFAVQEEGVDVLVEADNKLTGKYSLKKNQLISAVGPLGISEIEIKDGQARIVQSPCLRKVCIKMGWIKHSGKIAACVPNKVVVRVAGENLNGMDAVVG
tara:strand:- start:2737 stop:3105 length:369 start_codon:yes stop_codon:yes gene_type:complete